MSNNEKNKKTYDYDAIKKIAKRINRIKDKKIIIEIIKIIKTINPELILTENDNGILMRFNMLSQETYAKLDNYIHKNISKKICEISENSVHSEYIPYSTEDISSTKEKYKLSNKEKTLIKKQKYAQSDT